ncbi:MAG TPA: 2-oxo acid dehydrogenase subunit E2, partial [Gammaproteobacteria bacterium]|nr:2-oxo acid dehydrogenase subunit E2 [Gammaproteobacteria bacterium]
AIAATMAHAKREIPHYYLAMPVDMAPALAWLAQRNADRPPDERLLLGVLLVKAVAKATARFAEFNGF